MATRITEDCTCCGACVSECPNEAIAEGDEQYMIDPDRCTECVGFFRFEACQSVCPVECCLPDPGRPETEEVLFARAVRLHPELAGALHVSLATSRFRLRKLDEAEKN